MKLAELPPLLKGMRIRVTVRGERAFNAVYDGTDGIWLLYARGGKDMAVHMQYVEQVWVLPSFKGTPSTIPEIPEIV